MSMTEPEDLPVYDYLACDECVTWVEAMRPEFEQRLVPFPNVDGELEIVRFAGMFHRNGHVEPGAPAPAQPELKP